jgi:hypothetical protein
VTGRATSNRVQPTAREVIAAHYVEIHRLRPCGELCSHLACDKGALEIADGYIAALGRNSYRIEATRG